MNIGATGAATAAGSGSLIQPGGAMGKEEFLQLLVAQLRNQDPMNPMESQEFASQLAQFSSVEQLIQMNEQMGAQADFSQAMIHGLNANAAMGVLGREVLASTDSVELPESGTMTVLADVPAGGGTVTVRLLDELGQEVGSKTISDVAGGRQSFELDAADFDVAAGKYRIAMESGVGDAEPVKLNALVRARVDGIRYGPEGLILTAGAFAFPLSAVLEVTAITQPEEATP